MKILAIAPVGAEYVYSIASVHAVPAASAEKIRSALNNARFRLSDGQTWHPYDVDMYDAAYQVASFQRFYIRAGKIFEKR